MEIHKKKVEKENYKNQYSLKLTLPFGGFGKGNQGRDLQVDLEKF
jgi:hypothetical protein